MFAYAAASSPKHSGSGRGGFASGWATSGASTPRRRMVGAAVANEEAGVRSIVAFAARDQSCARKRRHQGEPLERTAHGSTRSRPSAGEYIGQVGGET